MSLEETTVDNVNPVEVDASAVENPVELLEVVNDAAAVTPVAVEDAVAEQDPALQEEEEDEVVEEPTYSDDAVVDEPVAPFMTPAEEVAADKKFARKRKPYQRREKEPLNILKGDVTPVLPVQSQVTLMKEQMHLRVMVGDSLAFVDVTPLLGKPSPYSAQVRSILSTRISQEVIAYSILQVRKSNAQRILGANKPLTLPRRNFYRVESTALELAENPEALAENEMLLVIDGDSYKYTYTVTDGVLKFDALENEDVVFELPLRELTYDVYFRSSQADRVIAISYRGFVGKPGAPETFQRLVARALVNMVGSANFQIVTGISVVRLPYIPDAPAVRPALLKSEKVQVVVPTAFYDEAGQEIQASGRLLVDVDLENANAATGQLVFHLTPSEELAPAFPVYEDLLRQAINAEVEKLIPIGELKRFTYDIVLADLDVTGAASLRSYMMGLKRLDATPSQYRAVVDAQIEMSE